MRALFFLLLIVLTTIESFSQTFNIARYEPSGNGYIWKNVVVKGNISPNTKYLNTPEKFNVRAVLSLVSGEIEGYKYNGKIYPHQPIPIGAQAAWVPTGFVVSGGIYEGDRKISEFEESIGYSHAYGYMEETFERNGGDPDASFEDYNYNFRNIQITSSEGETENRTIQNYLNIKKEEDKNAGAQNSGNTLKEDIPKDVTRTSSGNTNDPISAHPNSSRTSYNHPKSSYDRKMEERRRQITRMKQELVEQKRRSENLNRAADQTMDQWAQQIQSGGSNFIDGVQPLAEEFARQGNVEGAIGSVVVGTVATIFADASKRKKEQQARERAQAERDRLAVQRRERERKYKAEQERLRLEAQKMDIAQRKQVLQAFRESLPIPLASDKVDSDRVYYFLFSTDPGTIDKENTTVHVSNVFEIGQYANGTWPYERKVKEEIGALTPHTPSLQGYYLKKDDAEFMRQEFINGLSSSKGVEIKEVLYPGKPKAEQGSAGETNPLGIPLNKLKKGKQHSLGKPIPNKKPKKKTSGSLGIPINNNN